MIEKSELSCKECNDYGFIAWFPAQGPQGIAKAIVPPGNNNFPAKQLIFEACVCDSGKKFAIILE